MSDSFSLADYFAAREGARRAFCDHHGFAHADIVPLYEDMASRRFYRLSKGEQGAVLMDSLPDAHPQATLGHKLHDYVRLAGALREQDIHAPEIFAADEHAGFILMEDLGDAPMDEAHLDQAVETLIRLRDGFVDNQQALPDYFFSHIHRAHRRVIDWYAPSVRSAQNPDGLAEEYIAVWQEIERDLPLPVSGFVHADFHRGNLRLIHGTCGVLDFQGAQWGPLAYDLVNLLEDARAVTPEPLKTQLKNQYIEHMNADARESFEAWYAVLSAQFHCRVAGQFIKLALAGGKPQYLQYLPLVQAYVQSDLKHPLLKPLRDWFAAHKIDFSGPVSPSHTHIRGDAF